MKTILLIAAATMAAAMMAPGTAYAQKKKAQKRENHEFSFELPVYVEELKKELTYPLAWGNSGIKDFDEWRAAARKKVQECMMAAPRRAASFDAKTIAEERRDGYTARKVEFNVNAYSRITAYILVPDGKGPFPAVNVLLSGTRRDDLLYQKDQGQRIWILRKLLADMNPTEAMNFMLQLMDEYKTNQDVLDNMSKVTPRDAKYYDNF